MKPNLRVNLFKYRIVGIIGLLGGFVQWSTGLAIGATNLLTAYYESELRAIYQLIQFMREYDVLQNVIDKISFYFEFDVYLEYCVGNPEYPFVLIINIKVSFQPYKLIDDLINLSQEIGRLYTSFNSFVTQEIHNQPFAIRSAIREYLRSFTNGKIHDELNAAKQNMKDNLKDYTFVQIVELKIPLPIPLNSLGLLNNSPGPKYNKKY